MNSSDASDFLQELLPDGSISIKSYLGDSSIVTIPGEIDGRKVSKIESGAFYYFDCIEQVIIQNGVEVIGDSAFTRCENLKCITLPSSIKAIEKDAFKDIYGLREVRISSLVDWLGIDFANRESNPSHFCAKLYLGDELISKLVIPDRVSIIKQYAFYDCGISEVAFPSGLREIGDDSFAFCSNLKKLAIPDNVEKIGDGAFDACEALESIEVGQSNKIYYGKDNCIIERDTQRLVLGCKNSVIPNEVKIIGDSSFFGCNGLTSLVLPEGVKRIERLAFTFCKKLTSIKIPDSVTYIGDDAFNTNGESTQVYIKDVASWCNIDFRTEYSNPLIYDGNLYLNGQPVTHLTIPDGVTAIHPYAFISCKSIESVTIPSSVREIGECAFEYCSNLKEIFISDGVTDIAKDAFSDCGLTAISLPNGLTEISEDMFARCRNLTSVTIPDSVTCIRNYAFSGCDNLTQIVIPIGVKKIEKYAFHMLDNATIYCQVDSQPTTWEEGWSCGRPVVWGYAVNKK